VLYYSNAILARSFPTLGKYVSLAITLVNAGMTVPAIFLVDVRPPHAAPCRAESR
jgi:CCR4-NOT transcription complex subunit 1